MDGYPKTRVPTAGGWAWRAASFHWALKWWALLSGVEDLLGHGCVAISFQTKFNRSNPLSWHKKGDGMGLWGGGVGEDRWGFEDNQKQLFIFLLFRLSLSLSISWTENAHRLPYTASEYMLSSLTNKYQRFFKKNLKLRTASTSNSCRSIWLISSQINQ